MTTNKQKYPICWQTSAGQPSVKIFALTSAGENNFENPKKYYYGKTNLGTGVNAIEVGLWGLIGPATVPSNVD